MCMNGESICEIWRIRIDLCYSHIPERKKQKKTVAIWK